MSSFKIEVSGLGKAYTKYEREWKRIASWFGLPFKPSCETWVLKDISFQMRSGEAIGVMGVNGAGKSTLLKLLTGTIKPSSGNIAIHGRVAAILELGFGFNPELTGRDNVFLSSGYMGMGYEDIEFLIPNIKDFSELGDYFDQPVRSYSSGMVMRLAFSVVTAVRPDVLIIDEALSVGDVYFQHKCIDKIRKFKEEGTTILFVSHDSSAILSLCDRAILLERGNIIMDDSPDTVVDFYNAKIAEKEGQEITINPTFEEGRKSIVSGSKEVMVEHIALLNEAGKEVEHVGVGDVTTLRARVRACSDVSELVFGFQIKNKLGVIIFGTNTFHTKQILKNVKAGRKYVFEAKMKMELGVGSYSVSTSLHDNDTHLGHNYEWKDLAFVFTVENYLEPVFIGQSYLRPDISVLKGGGND